MVIESSVKVLRSKLALAVQHSQTIRQSLIQDIENDESMVQFLDRSLSFLSAAVTGLKLARSRNIGLRSPSRSRSNTLINEKNYVRQRQKGDNPAKLDDSRCSISKPLNYHSSSNLQMNSPKFLGSGRLLRRVHNSDFKTPQAKDSTTIVIQNNIKKFNYCLQSKLRSMSQERKSNANSLASQNNEYSRSRRPGSQLSNSIFPLEDSHPLPETAHIQSQAGEFSKAVDSKRSETCTLKPRRRLSKPPVSPQGNRNYLTTKTRLLQSIDNLKQIKEKGRLGSAKHKDSSVAEASAHEYQNFIGPMESGEKPNVHHIHRLLNHIGESVDRAVKNNQAKSPVISAKSSMAMLHFHLHSSTANKIALPKGVRPAAIKVPTLNLDSPIKYSKN